MASREVVFPVPWGTVAGKTWGDEDKQLVLLLHGLQDNCGSFDPLQPYLPSSFRYIAIDLPGHGRSSHLQKGIPQECITHAYVICCLADSNNWKNLILIGHSFGAIVSALFATFFPHLVDRVVLIDGTYHRAFPPNLVVEKLREHYDSVFKIASWKTFPSYSYEDSLNRVMTKRNPQLSLQVAKTLLDRNLIPADGKYRFSLDPSLKLLFCPSSSFEQLIDMAVHLVSPTLLVLSTQTYEAPDKTVGEGFKERVELFMKHVPNLTTEFVEGNHNLHMETPEVVAPYINKFLLNEKCLL